LRRGEDGAASLFAAELGALDAHVAKHGWLGGTAFGLADIAYVPWILRAQTQLGVDLDGLPALGDWLARLLERPSIAAEAGVVAAL